MPHIKVTDMAYSRLKAPDLDVMEEFLLRFGMVRAARTAHALYMRGTDPPHIFTSPIWVSRNSSVSLITRRGEDDLKNASPRLPAPRIENLDEPGGGKRVRINDPNGYQIEVVYGMSEPCRRSRQVPVAPLGPQPPARAGELMRLPNGPAQVKRVAHGVMMTPQFTETIKWYREMLGFVCSDDVYAGDPRTTSSARSTAATAVRPTSIITSSSAGMASRNGLNHVSFEVQDIDDVMLGHDHLTAKG